MSAASGAPDIIGFGALNVDYIAGASKLSAKLAERVAEWNARFEWGVEGAVDDATVYRVIRQLGVAALDASLGGSAWNTIFGLAQMHTDVRLGYVGVVGRVDYPGLSFLRQMDELRIDRRFVLEDTREPCGLCLSYIEDGQRVMLTRPGANLAMARFIRDRFEDLARYLSRARIVHVTSFLDQETPGELLRVLRRARELNQRLVISLDLSHDWAAHPSEPILAILRLAGFVFLSYREFKALGMHAHGEPDGTVADRVLGRCAPGATVLVTKQYDLIDVFRASQTGPRGYQFAGAPIAVDQAVEDSTGAGDVFSAGVLAALASRRLHAELGVYLGSGLARHKVRHRGFGGYQGFPELTRNILRPAERPEPPRPSTPGTGVFIAHGVDPQWEAVRRFLEQECRVPVYALAGDVSGANLDDAMRQHLFRCTFGVCVLATADTLPGEGRAEQSLVHQAGVLQGRYGFRRVAMLVEQGCATFSNVAGLIRLDFEAGHVESTFWQLERMLRREGVAHIR